MIKPFNWKCPHCERDVTITSERYTNGFSYTDEGMQPSDGTRGLSVAYFVCPNVDCRKTTIDAVLRQTARVSEGGGIRVRPAGDPIGKWRLQPWGASRSFPDCVPQAIREDYAEACAIKDLSPKAAATLARRAVQGIVRDYWGIKKATLNLELKALEERIGRDVTQETWDNIDAVRTVGNIGAHMEKDINLIVEVEPHEAELLIQLVESLIEDTYLARAAREERSRKIRQLKANKVGQAKAATAPAVAAGLIDAPQKPQS